MRTGRKSYYLLIALSACALIVVSVLTFLQPSTVLAERSDSQNSRLGMTVGDFSLPHHLGETRSLSDFQDKKIVVLAFLGTECPLAKLYGPRLAELSNRYASQGVQFLGINSNSQDSPTEIASYVRTHDLSFPVLKDLENKVADQVGAQRTPEIFVLDQNRVVRYHGRIDDQYGVGYQRGNAIRADLALALDQLLAGDDVAVAETEPVGCFIGRVRHVEPTGDVTFSNQIVRLLNRRCVECHRESEIAPFSLTNYEEVIGWADTIREVVNDGRMPPWFADPKYGHFRNEARLTAAEKDLINTWVKNGCPEGDPSEIPPLPEFAEGWRIPQPDEVFAMSKEAFEIPAEGVVDYQYFEVDPHFTEDKYIVAAEARPGNHAVVHHIVVFFKAPDEKEIRQGTFVGYAPGMPPQIYEPGRAIRIPAGSQLVFQMHYTPNGSPHTDISEVGFVYADKSEIDKVVGGIAISPRVIKRSKESQERQGFPIPKQNDNYKVEVEQTIGRDTMLISMMPHMHLRGKAFRFEAIFPDDKEQRKVTLLDVPRYDFNWQLRYELAEPIKLPKGTRVICTAHYDNSEHNPVNPDPDTVVNWGDQSWDEMLFGFIGTMPAD